MSVSDFRAAASSQLEGLDPYSRAGAEAGLPKELLAGLFLLGEGRRGFLLGFGFGDGFGDGLRRRGYLFCNRGGLLFLGLREQAPDAASRIEGTDLSFVRIFRVEPDDKELCEHFLSRPVAQHCGGYVGQSPVGTVQDHLFQAIGREQ